jgi:type I restriction enzyme, S subunit
VWCGWKIATLNEICHYIKDGPHVSPHYTNKGVPFISVHNIVDGYFDLSDLRYISEDDHKKYCIKCKPEKGDVLYSKGGTTGIAKRVDVDYEFSIWVHLALLKIKRDIINAEYLEVMLNSEFCKFQARNLTRGIANRDLVLGQMKQIKILLPPISLQQKFATIYETIQSLRQKQLEAEKKILLLINSLTFKLFKGKTKDDITDIPLDEQ